MNKTVAIVMALLVLAFIGYFSTKQVVSNKASDEIESPARRPVSTLKSSGRFMSLKVPQAH